MNEQKINIIIVDDHYFLREGLKKILSDESDIKVIAEAGNADDGLELIRKLSPDIGILDISLPGKSGLDILKDIKLLNSKIKILMLSMHPEERFAVRAIKSGASGYLTKESAPDELVKAIRTVLKGKKYVSKEFAERLVDLLAGDSDKVPHELLSDREFEVFIKIASGKKTSIIAKELSLSINTVNTYRLRILDKMNLESNVELTQYALKNNLVD